MSLTNYLSQSIIGSFIYFGYGLSLYSELGVAASFGVGIVLFILQLGFCHWWLKNHKQGPSKEPGVKRPGFVPDLFLKYISLRKDLYN